jgi:hypothetical protein
LAENGVLEGNPGREDLYEAGKRAIELRTKKEGRKLNDSIFNS